jgi:hypothetical protein
VSTQALDAKVTISPSQSSSPLSVPWNINGDFIVNILDFLVIGNSFLAWPGHSNWNPNADINSDGVVNILDAIILGNHFLQHYP